MSSDPPVQLAFEREQRAIPIAQLVPLKALPAKIRDSSKYARILRSIRVVGLVEAPVVAPDPVHPGTYFLLDGHLRIEALKDLGETEAVCLVSTDDEGYTYNKQINRLTPIQEHMMVRRAIERGVPERKIADALGLEVASIDRRARLLNGICTGAVDLLKDVACPVTVFDQLRQMAPARQVEAAELMVGQNNFTIVFAKALLAATPEHLLARPSRKASSVSSEQIARMERELASLQSQVKSVEETFGVDTLHLTVAKGYVRALLANPCVLAWIERERPEYLPELQAIAEIETVAPVAEAAE